MSGNLKAVTQKIKYLIHIRIKTLATTSKKRKGE
jgi:hypothetical protein